jgi:hypothetical protein
LYTTSAVSWPDISEVAEGKNLNSLAERNSYNALSSPRKYPRMEISRRLKGTKDIRKK